jgi:polyphenol oxidase
VYQSFRLGADGIYRCEAFEEFVWQQHGFGTRAANPRADVTLRQIHSSIVLSAGGLKDRDREGDALITDEIGKSIGVRTADCVPILLLDSKTHAVGVVHAGWRGTAAQIVMRAIEGMQSGFATNPGDVYAAIGPSIRACCYEVGEEVAGQFDAAFRSGGGAGKAKVNLALANRAQLQGAGLWPGNIFDSELCTACLKAKFFSYRCDPLDSGRMTAAIQRLA